MQPKKQQILFSIQDKKGEMTMFILYAEPYQITTKKNEKYDRLRLYIKDEKTGELLNFHDISFRSTPKQIIDVLTEYGRIKIHESK